MYENISAYILIRQSNHCRYNYINRYNNDVVILNIEK